MRGGWRDPEAPELFARYCDRLMDSFGDKIAYGVPAYRLANVMLPEDMDAMAEGMTAGHLAGKAAIKARRPDLPIGLSVAIVDDVVEGDDASVRDRKRAEVYDHWLRLAQADDFVGVQNYERIRYDGEGPVPIADRVPRNQMGSAIEPLSLAGAVAYAFEVAQVPVLVTEHGMSTDDDLRAGVIEPALAALLDVMDAGVPVVGYLHWTLLDNFEWILGYGPPARSARRRPRDLRADCQTQRGRLLRHRQGARRHPLRKRVVRNTLYRAEHGGLRDPGPVQRDLAGLRDVDREAQRHLRRVLGHLLPLAGPRPGT
jgi:beta-glucosidase/6-phospho-beta-glucosidase/beta-galactosidase